MEVLYNKFINLFMEEFNDLQIGHSYDINRITELRELMYVLFLLENKEMSREEAIRIIEIFV